MIVLDSSVWIELLIPGTNAAVFQPLLIDRDDIIVPSIVMFEVNRVLARLPEYDRPTVMATMSGCTIVDLDADLALYASEVAQRYRLAMGDAIIYATAIAHDAELWTQDADLKDLPGVQYVAKEA